MGRSVAATTAGAVLALIVAVLLPNPAAAVDCGTDKSHNFIQGDGAHIGGKLAFEHHVQVDGHWFRTVSADVASDHYLNKIIYIEVTDGYTNGNGGCTFVKSGGLYDYHVDFYFKSQFGYGLDFTIKVYTFE